jgi:hypothetical protein
MDTTSKAAVLTFSPLEKLEVHRLPVHTGPPIEKGNSVSRQVASTHFDRLVSVG